MLNQTKDRGKKQSGKDCFLLFKNNIYFILGICIAVSICMYGIISIYGFSAFPDEFGYWSPAAAVLGYDWSEITGLSSYYSYGYSALLTPILLFFHGAITTYRAAIILNLFLQCLSIWLFILLIKELFPDEDQNTRAIIATIAVIYPAWSFYVQTTMAESVLYFGLVLSVYLFLRFLRKPGIVSGLLLAVILIYLYMVHMRCIGTIIAGAVTIFLWAICQKKKNFKKQVRMFFILALLIILFAATFVLKDRIIQILYHQTSKDVLSWNDYSGIMFRLKKIVNLKGFSYLVKDFCGKALYMGLSTFGIAYFGIAGCVKKAYLSIRKLRKRQASYNDFLWIYIFLMILFQFLVALIYLNGASAPEADRLDNFLHGRYIDFFLPILFVIGLEEMLHCKRPYMGFVSTLLIYLVLSMVAINVITTNNVQMRNAHDFTMVGMSFFIETPLTDTMSYFKKELLLLVGLTLTVDAIVILCRRFGQKFFLASVLIIQIVLGVKACTQFIFLNQSYIYEDVMMADVLKNVTDRYPERKVIHIFNADVPYIQLVQFGCRDVPISVVNAEDKEIAIGDYMSEDNILIICECQDYEPILDDYYDEKYKLGHLRLYYSY